MRAPNSSVPDSPDPAICSGPGGPCCGTAGKPTMSDYIDRGLRRARSATLPIVGDARHDAGRYARFSLRVERGVVTGVAFDASVCGTLVAYCEVLAEWVTGLTIPAAARRIRPFDLTAALPLVPAYKRDLALLASQAMMTTIEQATREERV